MHLFVCVVFSAPCSPPPSKNTGKGEHINPLPTDLGRSGCMRLVFACNSNCFKAVSYFNMFSLSGNLKRHNSRTHVRTCVCLLSRICCSIECSFVKCCMNACLCVRLWIRIMMLRVFFYKYFVLNT